MSSPSPPLPSESPAATTATTTIQLTPFPDDHKDNNNNNNNNNNNHHQLNLLPAPILASPSVFDGSGGGGISHDPHQHHSDEVTHEFPHVITHDVHDLTMDHLSRGTNVFRYALGLPSRMSRILSSKSWHLTKHASYKDTIVPSGPHASNGASTVNIFKSLVGAGVLSFALAYSWNGLVFTTLIILFMAWLMTRSSLYLLQCMDWHKVETYEDLVFRIYGERGALTLDVLNILRSFGSLVAYLVIIRVIMHDLLVASGFKNASPTLMIIIVAMCVILPLSLLRDLNSLRFTSFLSLTIMTAFTITVVASMPYKTHEDTWHAGDIRYFRASVDFFRSLPIVCFAMGYHLNMVVIRAEMVNRSIDNVRKVVGYGFGMLALPIFILVGAFGYLSFLQHTKANVVDNYAASNVGAVMKIAVGLNIGFTYPIVLRPMVIGIDYVLFHTGLAYRLVCRAPPSYEYLSAHWRDEHHEAVLRHQFESFIVIVLTLLVSIYVSNMSIAVGLSGALGTSSVTLIFPGLLWLRTFGGVSGRRRWYDLIVGGYLPVCIGIVVTVCGAVVTLVYAS